VRLSNLPLSIALQITNASIAVCGNLPVRERQAFVASAGPCRVRHLSPTLVSEHTAGDSPHESNLPLIAPNM
jgi:hypothetical protein